MPRCRICKQEFPRLADLVKHHREQHQVEQPERRRPRAGQRPVQTAPQGTGTGNEVCAVCGGRIEEGVTYLKATYGPVHRECGSKPKSMG